MLRESAFVQFRKGKKMKERKGLEETPDLSNLIGQWRAKRKRRMELERAGRNRKPAPAKIPLFKPRPEAEA